MKPETKNELENSTEILTKLQAEADAATQKARAQAARVAAMTREFELLPEQASRLTSQLGALAMERQKLGPALDAEFERHYRVLLSGGLHVTLDCDALSARILSRELRFATISKIEQEVNSALRVLDKRNKELARALGQKPHQLSR